MRDSYLPSVLWRHVLSKRARITGCAIGLLSCLSTALGAGNAPLRAKAGAYYFDGWTSRSNHITARLRTEFRDREPVWGWNDDSLPIVEQQIDCAADNGLAFFAFDWYYPEGPDKHTPLNTGLELYLRARNRSRLEFCLLVANHGGFRIRPADWDEVSRRWTDLFRQPTHLRVNGRPLIIFFSPAELEAAFGTTESLRQAFERLRTRARDAGLPGVTIAAACTPGPEHHWSDLQKLAQSGFDVFTGYNYHGYPVKRGSLAQEFSSMIAGHEEIWSRFAARTSVPYIPVVTVGWDKRPWEDASTTKTHGIYYPDRTPGKVTDFVRRAVTWMDANPERTTRERLLLIYAWNENGEGGYLTPTKSEGDIYLRAVHQGLLPATLE